MNFIVFPASATNIFPASNTESGGQLVTEWNLRSREMVGTDPKIQYQVGPSYVHGEQDFEVSVLRDSGGVIVNSYTLQISEGRAVINGHYVETLVPITIDLLEANVKLHSESRPVLKGALAVGIRTFYATEQTVAGTILVEDDNDMYLGVQIVILPEEEMILPEESPTDKSKVTADIRLATFTFVNNNIATIKNLSSKMGYLAPERVTNIDKLVSSKYVTKIGLNSKKLYAFAGKGYDPQLGHDTWEDVTDSTMVWDADPVRTSEKPAHREAQIVTTTTGVYFVIPHKQVYGMTNDQGDDEYYASKIMEFPIADYTSSTAGMVNVSYTNQIKDLATQVSQFRTSLTGKQILYLDTKDSSTVLPVINDAWANGDYILVRSDASVVDDSASDTEGIPSTMYVVLPGQVLTVEYIATTEGDADNEPAMPSDIDGCQLGIQYWYKSAGQSEPDVEHPEYYPKFFADGDVMLGVPYNTETNRWEDYFRIRYYLEEPDPNNPVYPFKDFYYGVKTSGPRVWSDAVIVTGAIPLATESNIGGFYNASEQAKDYGYVRVDDTGHLRLIDYELLRSGTLAYQLGNDITIPSGSDPADIQLYLDEYVNQRVAFTGTPSTTLTPPVIHVYLPLEAYEESATLEINGIDCRFNTAVCLHIQGSANKNTTINIRDCQKFMIDSQIEGTPTLNIVRTSLRYDPSVLEYIKTCERDSNIYGTYNGFEDLSLWYERFEEDDPNLVVNGMTVSELDSQIITSDIDYWKDLGAALNDNNFLVALKSITFSGRGEITGCEVLVANNSTDNVEPGNKITVGSFVLPQGSSLIYPLACMTKVIKVSGEFTSAYYSDENWYVTDNSFSLCTGVYDPTDLDNRMKGTVAFHSTTTLIRSTISQTSIDVWEPDSYHIFSGGAIS